MACRTVVTFALAGGFDVDIRQIIGLVQLRHLRDDCVPRFRECDQQQATMLFDVLRRRTAVYRQYTERFRV